MRITEKDLKAVVQRINSILGASETPWTFHSTTKTSKANIGNYHISHAYGGVALHRMMREGGGISDVFSSGHIPKKELYYMMQAFITGIGVAD